MLRKLRERFILSAMAAFGIVMLMLVAGINALNYKVTVDRQDDMLAGIMEYEQIRESRPPGDKPPMISDMPWADGPEADFTTRFFIVHCNGEGQLMDIFHEHISSVDQEEIRKNWVMDRIFEPAMEAKVRERKLRGWRRAVECAHGWAEEEE